MNYIFWCPDCNEGFVEETESKDCEHCRKPTVVTGWIEENNSND